MATYEAAEICPMCDGTMTVIMGPDKGKKCKDCNDGWCNSSDGYEEEIIKTRADFEKKHKLPKENLERRAKVDKMQKERKKTT